jgi:uncharacterized OsmC-like protein
MTSHSITLKIDPDGLAALAAKADATPGSTARTLKVKTVCAGAYLNATYVRDLEPMMVDEPPGLLGTDTAPNPSEAALAALGSCISVGIVANATARGITLHELSIELEGDIDIAAVWGVADNAERAIPGFSAVRVGLHIKGDASREELDALQRHAMAWSPVVNTFTRPVHVSSSLLPDD